MVREDKERKELQDRFATYCNEFIEKENLLAQESFECLVAAMIGMEITMINASDDKQKVIQDFRKLNSYLFEEINEQIEKERI